MIDQDLRHRLADLLSDLQKREPEAINAAGEVIALFLDAQGLRSVNEMRSDRLARMQLRPMSEAPHGAADTGPSVLLKFKDDLSQYEAKGAKERRLDRWEGLFFVGRHHGFTRRMDLDMGWGFAAPVGQGGFPDAWLEGWAPLDFERLRSHEGDNDREQ